MSDKRDLTKGVTLLKMRTNLNASASQVNVMNILQFNTPRVNTRKLNGHGYSEFNVLALKFELRWRIIVTVYVNLSHIVYTEKL